jgi:hypothetical protein
MAHSWTFVALCLFVNAGLGGAMVLKACLKMVCEAVVISELSAADLALPQLFFAVNVSSSGSFFGIHFV